MQRDLKAILGLLQYTQKNKRNYRRLIEETRKCVDGDDNVIMHLEDKLKTWRKCTEELFRDDRNRPTITERENKVEDGPEIKRRGCLCTEK